MIFRSLFALTLIIVLLVQTLNAINPEYIQELTESNNNQVDSERSMYALKHNDDDEDVVDDDEDYLKKRNKYPNFYLSPLWLSRRTRSNRLFGKPLWISRTGRSI